MPDIGFFAGRPPRVIAHRGLALDAEENTLAAFRAALDAGADVLETDVHASRDGAAVLCHDDDLSRVAGTPRRVGELTLDELRGLPLERGGVLATFDEALAAFPDARFNVDVKEGAAVPAVARAVADADAAGRVLVASFGQRRRRRAVRRLPGAATSASVPGVVLALIGAVLRCGPLVRAALREVDAMQVPPRRGPFPVVTPVVVRAVHAAGREVHVWTIDDQEEMGRLLDLGVDGIVSNRCDLLAETVARRAAASADRAREEDG